MLGLVATGQPPGDMVIALDECIRDVGHRVPADLLVEEGQYGPSVHAA